MGLKWSAEEDNTVSIMQKGIWSIETAAMWTYVTGFTYNMRLCHSLNAIETLEKLRCGKAVDWRNEEMMLDRTTERNLCVEIYTNNCLAMMLCRYGDFAHFKLDMFDVKKITLRLKVVLTWEAGQNAGLRSRIVVWILYIMYWV